MQISYKFWYVSRDTDTGLITEAAIRYYEGEEKDVETGDVITGDKKTERRYVRTRQLSSSDIPEIVGEFKAEANGSFACVYRPSDFGKIKTDDELRLFLNKEMAKHKGRSPQKDQAEVSDISKVK